MGDRGHGQIVKYKDQKMSYKTKECNSLWTKMNNSSNILGMQKKEEKSEFGRGYNTALKKCNKRANYIIRKMFEAYKEAIENDEDYDEDEYSDDE